MSGSLSPATSGFTSNGTSMPVASTSYRRWEPVPKILYGFAVAPFAPEADSLDLADTDQGTDKEASFQAIQPHLIGLEVGDEVYVFEQLGHDSIDWYRGYVVSTNRVPTSATSASSLSDYSTFPSTSAAGATLVEEPQVYVGIFPRVNVHIREELDDAELRLADIYAQALSSGVIGASTPTPPKSHFGQAHMETLPEEDENAASQPTSPVGGDFASSSEAGHTAVNGTGQGSGAKVTFNPQRQSLVLQEQQASEQRPPPPLPSLKCGDETASGSSEPLIDEIACALREWSTLMYAYLGRREYSLFHSVREHFERLHAARRQLLAQTLSEEESARLRRECVAQLVKGNVRQGLDVIVRHPRQGGLVDIDFSGKEVDLKSWISAIHLYALQSALAYVDAGDDGEGSSGNDPWLGSLSAFGGLAHGAPFHSTMNAPLSASAARKNFARKNSLIGGWPDNSSNSQRSLNGKSDPSPEIKYFHVFVELRTLAASPCQPGETAELYFSLYNRSEARFLTEEFCVVIDHQGLPTRAQKGRLRMLFTDLSINDMHDLNVICRIVRHGAMRLSSSGPNRQGDYQQDSPSLREAAREDTAGFRTSRMATDRTFRRPFGCAVVELGQEHAIRIDSESSSALRDHSMPIFVPTNESAFSTLHQDIIASRVREIDKSPRAEALTVSVKVFYGEKSTLVRENPALLQDVVHAARLGFPDVVLPGDTRNEVYIKLWSGEFFPHITKVPVGSPQKNIQVSVEVRKRDGSVIERAISRGAGEEPVTQFDSLVFLHQNAPTWGELLKLRLPSEHLEDCHLFFTFRYRSSKEYSVSANGSAQSPGSASHASSAPFANAYLPLFATNNAFIHDGSHTLMLWRSSRAAQTLNPELYFSLPALVPAGQSLVDVIPSSMATIFQPLRDTLTLRTFLVSAKYTQNDVLLKLLNWENVLAQSIDELKDVLVKFPFVGEVETVKFLRDIFDALFGIIVSPKNGAGELDDLVFNSLITVLGIVQDRRFYNFRATLDVYIEQHYHSQTAYTRLMSSMAKLLANPTSTETSKELRASIKVWPYLFKFIIRSRENQRGVDDPLGALGGAVSDHLETSFRRELNAILRSINRLMSTTKPNSIIGTQTLALQNFAGLLPEMARVFPIEELARIEVAFADSVFATSGRIAIWKLLHVLHVARDTLLDDHAARSSMLPSFIRWIRPHIGRYEEVAAISNGMHDGARDADRVAWAEAARLAVTIIALILDKLQKSIVHGRQGKMSQGELRQEQDNIDYMLSMMPKLLETYIELDSSTMRAAIQRHRSPSTVVSDVPIIFPTAYPFPLFAKRPPTKLENALGGSHRRIQRQEADYLNCGLGEVAAVLIVLVMLSPKRHLSGFLDEQLDVDGRDKQVQLLKNYFQVATSILRNEAYPGTWLNVNILAHQMVLKMSDPLAALLIRDYIPSADRLDEFDPELWQAGLSLLLTLLSSDQLVIERFKPQRRRAVWRLAGDIRGEGAHIFAKLWNSIGWPDGQSSEQEGGDVDLNRLNTGGFQVQFVPSLVEPVLELCLSHHDELRTCAVRVLATMITSEWHLNGNFAVIEAEIIDKLDVLFVSDTHGDDISRAFFIGQLRSLFENPQVDPKLQEQVHTCLVSVNRFLDLLLSVRSLPLEEGFEDDRVAGTLKLLGFLRQANRVTAFSTHVLRLVNLHLENYSYVEAALTLKLHADLHDWATDVYVDPIADLDLPRQSHFARKETLYMLILDYLNKAQAWEISIDICRELAREYEYRAVDYSRLADVLILQASLFQKIGTEERVFPSYFRVGYYGSEWPESLQGKSFVYRGNSWEKYSNFCERMHQRHPQATIIKGAAIEPYEEVLSSPSMLLQITSIQPEPDQTKDLFANPETPPTIRAYYEHNATDLFSFTRPILKESETQREKTSPEEQLANLWVEKTYLRVEDCFPTVLRRSEICHIEVVQISPIENALLDVDNKVKELETLEAKFLGLSKLVARHVPLNTNSLSMALNGAVDAPVNGGIPMYRRTFLTNIYLARHPSEEAMLSKLREAIDRQVAVIYRCILLHSRLCPPEMRPFHDSLERFFAQNFAEEIERLHLNMRALSEGHADTTDTDDSRTLHQNWMNNTNGSLSAAQFAKSVGISGSLDGLPSNVSPLQRHISYLTAQSQPMKASPTALDHPTARDRGPAVGTEPVTPKTPRATTATTRSITGDTITTATLPSSPNAGPQGPLSSTSSVFPHSSSASSMRPKTATSSIHRLRSQFQQQGGEEINATMTSLVSDSKSASVRRHSTLLSRMSESRDRASRMFRGDRRKS